MGTTIESDWENTRLLEELEAARAEIERKMSAGQFVLEQLSAEQAKNVRLREAYVLLENFAQSVGGSSSFWEDFNDKLEAASVIANFTQSDTSALEAIVKKASEVMREKCSSICKDESTDAFADGESEDWGRAAVMCSELIRAIPSVTLEDLK